MVSFWLSSVTERLAKSEGQSADALVIKLTVICYGGMKSRDASLRRGTHEFLVPGLPQLIALKLHAIRNDPRRQFRDLSDIAELVRLNPDKITKQELDQLSERFGPAGIRDKLPDLP
jgi:hypothetical protein